MSQDGKEAFRKARREASRKAGRHLSRGETLELLSNYYLDREDPERRKEGKRRTGETEGTPGRHVPEAVKRYVRRRSGNRCEYPGCPNEIWLEFAHIVPHHLGGSREADNLVYLCRWHNATMEEGNVSVEVRDGRAWFVAAWGIRRPGPVLLPEWLGPPPGPDTGPGDTRDGDSPLAESAAPEAPEDQGPWPPDSS